MNIPTRIALLGILMSGAVQAQPQTDAARPTLTDEQRARVEEIVGAQRERVQSLLDQQREQLRAERDAERERREAQREAERERQQALRDQMAGIREETLAELEEVLDPEQLDRMRAMIQRQLQGIAAQRNTGRGVDSRFEPRSGGNFRQPSPRDGGRFPAPRNDQRNFRR